MFWIIAASGRVSNTRWFWQSSPHLQIARMLLGALALLALALSSLPYVWKAVVAVPVVVDSLVALRHWRMRGHPAQRHGLMLNGEQWLYWTAQHGWREVRLGQGSLVWSWLVVLDMRPGRGRRLHLAVPWHVLPAESFRRLKVVLRFGKY